MASATKYRIAFVTPRYGEGVVGGSEAVMAEAARGLAGRGHDVEILTTCARSHFSWENEFEPGSFVEDGMTVHRFSTVSSGRHLLTRELESRAAARSTPVSSRGGCVGEQPAQSTRALSAPARDARRYDAIVLSPYLFWTTIYGAAAMPERSIIMPCLHDEPLCMALHRSVDACRGLAVVWFLSEPEHLLAHRVAAGLQPAPRCRRGRGRCP